MSLPPEWTPVFPSMIPIKPLILTIAEEDSWRSSDLSSLSWALLHLWWALSPSFSTPEEKKEGNWHSTALTAVRWSFLSFSAFSGFIWQRRYPAISLKALSLLWEISRNRLFFQQSVPLFCAISWFCRSSYPWYENIRKPRSIVLPIWKKSCICWKPISMPVILRVPKLFLICSSSFRISLPSVWFCIMRIVLHTGRVFCIFFLQLSFSSSRFPSTTIPIISVEVYRMR